jgi:hypothetical protein
MPSNADHIAICATLTLEKRCEIALEYIVGRLSLEPSVTAAHWRPRRRSFDACGANMAISGRGIGAALPAAPPRADAPRPASLRRRPDTN